MAAPKSEILSMPRDKIQKQHRLPFSKAIELSIKSLKVRFWRSIITTGGVVLAIAFLMWVWMDDHVVSTISERAMQPAWSFVTTEGGEGEVQADDKEAARQQLSNAGLKIESLGPSARQEELRRLLVKRDIPLEMTEEKREQQRTKHLWLVGLSLMVAAVGIVNAMLMSVTERFREIGTMKCLGALDSFIVKLFLLESSFQGALGTMLGIALGLMLNLLYNWHRFGGFFWDSAGGIFGAAMTYVLAALGIGVVLSIAGAIYPALVAARMDPVVAMRVEA